VALQSRDTTQSCLKWPGRGLWLTLPQALFWSRARVRLKLACGTVLAILTAGVTPLDEAVWQARRSLFPIFKSERYLAACSQGALCSPVEAAIERFMESWRSRGNPWETDWMPVVASTANKFARLIGAPSESIGITASVSTAMGTILSALDFSHRPRVIVSALDFPTLPDILLAYRQKGLIELEVLPARGGEIPLAFYEQAVDDRTSLVCLSSASYASGVQLPIHAVVQLAHALGALCLVDAYQTVGALAIDVGRLQPDFLISGTLKYLLGTSGVGLMYVAPEVARQLEPRAIGWMAAADPFGTSFEHLEYAAGAARFQSGTFTIPACYAADAALDLLLDIGADAIQSRVMRLARRFAEGVTNLGAEPVGPTSEGQLGPMVAVPVPGAAHDWQERLRRTEHVVTSARGNALRFAFHFYNDDSDVDACLDVLGRVLPGSSRSA
jgi:selenocysteine lyase/cysteine desulfurase